MIFSSATQTLSFLAAAGTVLAGPQAPSAGIGPTGSSDVIPQATNAPYALGNLTGSLALGIAVLGAYAVEKDPANQPDSWLGVLPLTGQCASNPAQVNGDPVPAMNSSGQTTDGVQVMFTPDSSLVLTGQANSVITFPRSLLDNETLVFFDHEGDTSQCNGANMHDPVAFLPPDYPGGSCMNINSQVGFNCIRLMNFEDAMSSIPFVSANVMQSSALATTQLGSISAASAPASSGISIGISGISAQSSTITPTAPATTIPAIPTPTSLTATPSG